MTKQFNNNTVFDDTRCQILYIEKNKKISKVDENHIIIYLCKTTCKTTV